MSKDNITNLRSEVAKIYADEPMFREDVDGNGEFIGDTGVAVQTVSKPKQRIIPGLLPSLHEVADAVVDVVVGRVDAAVRGNRDSVITFAEDVPIEFTAYDGTIYVGIVKIAMKAKPAPPEKEN